jgi:AraC family transcriptional regulator
VTKKSNPRRLLLPSGRVWRDIGNGWCHLHGSVRDTGFSFEWHDFTVRKELFFIAHPDQELFCHRQQRLSLERIEKVAALLRNRLANPPSLEEIGQNAGCSPFHLSRTFSAATGMTIPQYIRRLRMERAAELLRSGWFNVTEAALEVGYSSLSHFSQVFHETFGCCPGLYPLRTPTQKSSLRRGRI